MKHLILVLLISTSILTTTKLEATGFALETKTEHHDRLRIQDNLHLSADSSNDRVYFTLGDSLQQREEADRQKQLAVGRVSKTSNTRSQTSYGGSPTPYPYGWCTWYAAQQKGISTNYGNARNWPVNSKEPQVGAVAVTYESRLGHVAYVIAVNGDNITLREMNYAGWGKVSTRTVNYHKLPLKGFLI